jgi:hypothetical protein
VDWERCGGRGFLTGDLSAATKVPLSIAYKCECEDVAMASHVAGEEGGRRCRGGTSRRHQGEGGSFVGRIGLGTILTPGVKPVGKIFLVKNYLNAGGTLFDPLPDVMRDTLIKRCLFVWWHRHTVQSVELTAKTNC